MKQPNPTAGMHHLALYSQQLEACAHFYVDILGMKIIWQPDADNIYLSSGNDNLALHRAPPDVQFGPGQRLDHFGFFLKTYQDVDEWYEWLLAKKVDIKAKPKDHRDGTRSLYCADPDGNIIQLIYYPL